MPIAFVVIDTNTVFDWLLFDDPGAAPLAEAVQAGTVRWLACARMRNEFEHTLQRPTLARWAPVDADLLAAFDRWSLRADDPTHCADPGLQCSDPDDQVFIDLAICERASWLVTHDRALLRLARHARRFKLTICRPADWGQHGADGSSAS